MLSDSEASGACHEKAPLACHASLRSASGLTRGRRSPRRCFAALSM